METIYLSQVHTGSCGYLFREIPGRWFYLCHIFKWQVAPRNILGPSGIPTGDFASSTVLSAKTAEKNSCSMPYLRYGFLMEAVYIMYLCRVIKWQVAPSNILGHQLFDAIPSVLNPDGDCIYNEHLPRNQVVGSTIQYIGPSAVRCHTFGTES